MDREMSEIKELSLEERRNAFFEEWIGLDHERFREEQKTFFMNVIDYLLAKGKLTKDTLPELDDVRSEGQKKSERTYDSWMKGLCEWMASNKNRAQEIAIKHGLTHPNLVKRVESPGGKGNQIEYLIEGGAVDSLNVDSKIDRVADADTAVDTDVVMDEQDDELSAPHSKKVGTDGSVEWIEYQTKSIESPPWWVRLASPFFETQRTRVWVMLIALVGVVCAPVFFYLVLEVVKIILVPLGVNPTSIGLIAGTACLIPMGLISIPCLHIITLATQKMILMDSIATIRMPFSTICISEVTDQTDEKPYKTMRSLSAITVTAHCPLCLQRYGLKESIQLDRDGFMFGRVIGVCNNNPGMHRYSFDKDLMKGQRL